MLRILYLAWGQSDDLHVQARYSILSARAWAGADVCVHVFTDQPALYPGLAEPLPLMAVRSPFELKLRTVLAACERWPQDVLLFVDVDTFFIGPVDGLVEPISAGTPVLHRREYNVGTSSMPQTRRFRKALRKAGVRVDGDMWNSGVIGLPAGSAPLLQRALATYGRVAACTPKKFLSEQYAVSLALQEFRPPMVAEGSIFHYWYQKADYTAAVRQRLDEWRDVPSEQIAAQLRAAPIVLPFTPLRIHWWEQVLVGLGLRRRPPDTRGLPRAQ